MGFGWESGLKGKHLCLRAGDGTIIFYFPAEAPPAIF